MSHRIAVMAGALALVAAGCAGRTESTQTTARVAARPTTQQAGRTKQTAPKPDDRGRPPPAPDRPAPGPNKDRTPPKPVDPQRQEFEALVRANADDPSNFEIISWGEPAGSGRAVKFRCKKVGVTPALPGMGAVLPQKGGDPVMVDTAHVTYKNGKIESATLDKIYSVWRPAR